ncbi:RNA-directed DNA polymerase [Chitinophaga silvatica]|uniref:RNA-directed DNA polymerase n=1 Tax=Chitinophaga silvatica TaxID=2282649 RepID=A0A3E1YHH7_9BACT|nr:reverse transcriptase family protein [Chitinophaga silvatica]RFS26807.1 RNA-directed DNA polymerase [Chitinophaga silvatica]
MIQSLLHLQAVLGYSIEEMEHLISEKDKYYYHFSQTKGFEKGVEQFRHFFPSKKNLRDLHNRIHTRIFRKIPLPPHVHGSVVGRGNVTNTKAHQGKLYKLHTDLKSYFDFVSNKKVYDALRGLGFSQKVCHLLTELTTLNGHLPQGPPTSPFLANIVGLQMDNDLLNFCNDHQITYTRYVDDLGFSCQVDFKDLIPKIVDIINQNGFLISYKKTVYKKGRIEITGISIGQNNLLPTKKHLAKYSDPLTPAHTRKGLGIYFAGFSPKRIK